MKNRVEKYLSGNRKMLRIALQLALLLATGVYMAGCGQVEKEVVDVSGKYFQVEYPPSTDSAGLQLGVTYIIWIPPGVETVRGVIVHQHGAGIPAAKSGMTGAYDLHWQALAKKWDCVLMGPSYHVTNNDVGDSPGGAQLWLDPRRGSDKTFLRALDEFSEMSGHPEIKDVPWCLWGHSGGGIWSDVMSSLYPERVAAMWLRSGAANMFLNRESFHPLEITEAVYDIPIMCNSGLQEKDNGIWKGQMDLFLDYRANGAPIGFAPDPLTGHWCGNSRYLAIPYLDACLALRLPEKGSADQTLRKIDISESWFAPLSADTAMAAGAYDGEISEAVWLPNESIAKMFVEYVQTGGVSDDTPPPAPFNVTTFSVEGGNKVTWEAEADFESGIGHFIVLKDDEIYARVPEKPLLRFQVRPLFQSGWINSYNDSPVDPVPEMSFVDSTAQAGDDFSYAIVSVNSVGLPSEISDGSELNDSQIQQLILTERQFRDENMKEQ